MLRTCAAILVLICLCGMAVAAQKPQSDAAISDMVRIRLAGDPDVNGGALKVDMKDGVATLSGVVESQRIKEKAAKLAKKVKGVKRVVNNLTIKEKK